MTQWSELRGARSRHRGPSNSTYPAAEVAQGLHFCGCALPPHRHGRISEVIRQNVAASGGTPFL
jgi:hypothetical protein